MLLHPEESDSVTVLPTLIPLPSVRGGSSKKRRMDWFHASQCYAERNCLGTIPQCPQDYGRHWPSHTVCVPLRRLYGATSKQNRRLKAKKKTHHAPNDPSKQKTNIAYDEASFPIPFQWPSGSSNHTRKSETGHIEYQSHVWLPAVNATWH